MDAPNQNLLLRLQRLVLFSTFINYSFNFIYPLLALMLMDLGHWTAARAALVMAAAYAASSIGSPWIGRAIDRHHFGLPLAFAFFGNVLGVLALTSSSNPYVIFVAASSILFSAGCISTMTNYVREGLTSSGRRREVATQSYMVANVGYALGGVMAFYFLREHRALLLTLDVLSHVVIWAALWYASRQLSLEARARREKIVVASWREILTPRKIEIMVAALALFVAMNAQMSVLQFLYRTLGLDARVYAASTMAIGSLAVVIVGLTLPRLKLSLRTRTIGGAALACIGLSLQPLITSLTWNTILTACWATGEVLLNAELSQAFFLGLGPRNAGAGAGLRVFTSKMSLVLCPLIAVCYTPQTVPAFFLLFGLPSLIAGVVLYRIMRREEIVPPVALSA